MGRGKECLYTERMFGLTEKSPTVVTALYSVIVVLNWAAKSFHSEMFIAVWYLNTVFFYFPLNESFVFAKCQKMYRATLFTYKFIKKRLSVIPFQIDNV